MVYTPRVRCIGLFMSSVPPRQMLEAILKGATPAKDKVVFEEMWDALNRYGKLSRKQIAWIESVYYKLPKDIASKSGKTGKFVSSDVSREVPVRTIEYFRKVCPNASPSEISRIEKFFSAGGVMVKVIPKEGP